MKGDKNKNETVFGNTVVLASIMIAVIAIIAMAIVSVSIAAAPAASEVPPLPDEFYGTVTINGAPAPIGTHIIAEINGVERGNVTTTEEGKYGGSGTFDDRLNVQGQEDEIGHVITFRINGNEAAETSTFSGMGESKVLDLTITALEVPWQGYLVPRNSTGNYGEDTPVELWVDYNDTGLTLGAIAYQFDLHFDLDCVNVTAANFSTSPFNINAFTPYDPGVVRIGGNNYGIGAISSGTYRMATLTMHGECSENCTCNLWFDTNVVSDTNGNAIENRYTNGTYTCVAPQPEVVINEFRSYNTSGDWIELYNKGTSEVLLDGWSINDSDSEIHTFGASDSISAGGYLVVDVGSRLNRDGDTITLLKGSETIDEVTYGSGADEAQAPGEGNSTGRYPDGVDTGNDAADFIEFGTPTPGEPNVISISEVTISIGTVMGNKSVPIRIDNASNIGSADINIAYNSSVCVITEVTNGSFDTTFANMEQNETGLVRIGACQMKNPGLNGSIILANLSFRSTSASGTSTLNLSVNKLTDATPKCNDMPYIIVNGTFITFLNGDVNGNGEIELSDAMYLAKHVLDIQGFEDIVEAAADVNGNGEIELSDAMYLAKHVLGIPGFEELK